MSARLGISVDGARWRWAAIEVRGETVRVDRTGDVEPGDWEALARDARAASSVGIALPDRDVIARRIRVGHPPASLEALRQLVRWRIKDDLPYPSAAIDTRMEGDHALVVAADRAKVESIESSARVLGPVERVTSCGLAALGAFPAPGSGAVTVRDATGHARARYDQGKLAGVQLLESAPDPESGLEIDVAGDLPEVAGLDWGGVPMTSRGAFLPAVGAALDGLRLNLASSPPVPALARVLAWSAAAAGSALAVLAVVAAMSATAALATERKALAELRPAVADAVTSPPELEALHAVLRAGTPSWTPVLASLERTLPQRVRLERLEWKDESLRITVLAPKREDLESARAALAAHGRVDALSQGGDGATYRAELSLRTSP